MATGGKPGGGNIFDAKPSRPYVPSPGLNPAAQTPPGNALLAKEAAAGVREENGLNPGTSVTALLHGLLHAFANPVPSAYLGHPVAGGIVFTPGTAAVQAVASAPQIVKNAHQQAVQLAHPSAQNPPSLHREITALLSGAVGLPRMGINEKPHPLTAGKPTIQKGPAPTVPTLGEAVTGALKGAKGVRAGQESLRSVERAKRSEAFGKALQANPTAAGAKAARAELAGKYPALRFGGFEQFTPEAHDAMVKFITDHPNLGPWEPVRATAALEKIRAGVVPQRSEEKLLRKIFGNDTTKDLMESVSKWRQLKALGYDIGNLPRSVMASYDASGLLRQALLIATNHPVMWAKNVPGYFKAIRSEEYANKALADIHARPNAVNGYYDKIGLDLTEMAPRGQAGAREEAFRSPLAEKIPGVRASGRGYTVALDAMRADFADLMQAKAARMDGKMVTRLRVVNGKPRVVRERFDQHDQKLLDSIGSVVNSSSGRGDLGEGVLGRSQEGLNLLLFSPRLIKSRVDFINPYWYAKLDPLARRQAYRAMAGLVGLVATTDAIAHEAGASVNLDPRSSDFAKIRIGNTRIDLGGGFFQYMRLLSQLATQQVVSTSGKVTNLGPEGPGNTSDWDVVFRFIRSKLAPLTSATVDVSQQRNSVGQPLTWQNTVLSRLTPLAGQDAVSVGTDASNATGSIPAGVLAGLGAFGLSGIGGGVQNYTPKPPKPNGFGNMFDNSGSGSSKNPKNIFDK